MSLVLPSVYNLSETEGNMYQCTELVTQRSVRHVGGKRFQMLSFTEAGGEFSDLVLSAESINR